MKFGKRILQIAAANGSYSRHYLDYKSLKKLLKGLKELSSSDGDGGNGTFDGVSVFGRVESGEMEDAEERFMLALQGEFAKVESFFRSKVAEFMAVFRCLCKRVANAQLISPLINNPNQFADLAARLHPDDDELIHELLEFTHDVDALRGFVMTNSQALVKICKKHDKTSPIKIREHFMRVLSRCTFYNSREFGGLIADTKILLSEVFKRFTGKALVEEDASHFTCQLCSHVLCNPLELECGDIFCSTCVSLSTFFSQHRCPICFKVCSLSEEHMRVHTLRSHYERLIDKISCTASAEPCKDIGAEKDCDGALTLPRKRSLSFSSHISSTPSTGNLRRNNSDSALDDMPTKCTLDKPCEKCFQRSKFVQELRWGATSNLALRTSGNSMKRLIIERIKKENDERSEYRDRERRISLMSATSACSVASAAMSSVSEAHYNKAERTAKQDFNGESDRKSDSPNHHKLKSPPELIIPDHASIKEDSPWSPSKRWTACHEVLRSSSSGFVGVLGQLHRTPSAGVSMAHDMWRKVYAMEAQQKLDRVIRRRLWLAEILVLLFCIFFCVRVSLPEVLCSVYEESESPAHAKLLWHQTVCGSWAGLMTPAGGSVGEQVSQVADLQAERTRSLHRALDSMVARSMRK